MLYSTVLCLGDSLTFGARAEVDGHAGLGYPEHLPALLNPATPGTEWAVLNRGISGQVTRQVLDRAPGAFRELAACAGPKWAVILAGTNDSKAGGVPLDEWTTLYRQVLHWGRRAGVPMILGVNPNPDTGPSAGLARALGVSGRDYGETLAALVRQALERGPRRD